VIVKFVQVATVCAHELRNFETAHRIVAALHAPSIAALALTWRHVPADVIADLNMLVRAIWWRVCVRACAVCACDDMCTCTGVVVIASRCCLCVQAVSGAEQCAR
jgi:hypothetical protein